MRLEPVYEARCFAMPSRPIMKISQRHGFVAIAYRGSGLEIILRQVLIPLQCASFFLTAWRFICRLGTSLEAITLFPVAAMIVIPLFLYRLATCGYYVVLFTSKRESDES